MKRAAVTLQDHIKTNTWNLNSRKRGCVWPIRYRADLSFYKTRRWTFRSAMFQCSKDVRDTPVSSLVSAFSWILASFCGGLSPGGRRWPLIILYLYSCCFSIPVEKRWIGQSTEELGPSWVKYPLRPTLVAKGWRIPTGPGAILCRTHVWQLTGPFGTGRGNFSKGYKDIRWIKITNVLDDIF